VTSSSSKSPFIVMIAQDGMGHADQALRHILLRTYLQLLDESNMLPSTICFYADGVKMVVEDSPVLEPLKSLEEKGVQLIICSTCLNYFNLMEEVSVGIVGSMTDIIEAQWRAEKVITL
jgi:selenium metabolism protein YedF